MTKPGLQWELGRLPPLKKGDKVVICSNLTWWPEDHGWDSYHMFDIGTVATVMSIQDYGMAMLDNGNFINQVFFEDFKLVEEA